MREGEHKFSARLRYSYFVLIFSVFVVALNVFASAGKGSGRFAFTINPVSNAAVNENAAYTSVTPSISGSPNGSVTYRLSGPDAFDFSIDPATGVVSMIARNFEAPADFNTNNVYEVTITATDTGNNTSSTSWTVTVNDVIETASFTIGAIPDILINENTTYTSVTPALSGTTIGGTAPANFTIVPIPDTQFYSGEKNGGTNAIFKAQTNWIVANKDALNVKYIVHLGDCVDDGDNGGNDVQWRNAEEAISIIEDPVTTGLPDGIPYGPNVGNHDQSPAGSATGTTTFFNQYFGISRYSSRNYYGGHYGSNYDNNYQLFSASGMDFLAINLEYDPAVDADVINWADGIIKAYPARRVMLTSHWILNSGGSFSAQGQAIYNKIKENPNVFLMLCGHISAERSRTDVFEGRNINTLLSDYQGRTNGGDGWMRYMEFMPSENKVYVSTYSPTLNQFETDADSKFSFDYTMTGTINPGSVVYTLSGSDASKFTVNSATGIVTMISRNFEAPSDLNSDNIYELTLTATDADGNTAVKSWKVTVQDVIESSVLTISPIANATVNENAAYTSVIPVLNGTPIGSVVYTLGGADASKFTPNSSTGVVSMIPRDYGNPQDANSDNIYEIAIIATDEDGNIARKDWTVTVLSISNKIPVAVNDAICANEYKPVSLNISANDTDSDGTIDPATIDLDSAAGIQKSIVIPGQGTYTADNTGILTFTPVAGFKGIATPVSYTVKDNNAGISNSATITITVVPDPSVNIAITNGSQIICVGTSVTFTATPVNGGNLPFYQWQVNGVNAGSNSSVFSSATFSNGNVVTCTVKSDPACASPVMAASNSITISVYPYPVASITASAPLTFFSGGNVKLTASSGTGYSYQWMRSGSIINGQTSESYIATESGSYTVAISSGTCSSVSNPLVLNQVFGLPSTNFNITLTGESCKGSKNGSIRISASQIMNYTATISITGVNVSYPFTDLTEIKYLAAGTYKLCITVAGQADYSQCYDLVITQPKDLSVYTSVNLSNNTISLKLGGGVLYTVQLNGREYITAADQMTLSLQKGQNDLKVSTDKDCQGIIEKHINMAILYPNPFENMLNMDLGGDISAKTRISIVDFGGRTVHSQEYMITNGHITMDLSGLNKGIYLLKLLLNNSESIYKVQKN